MRIRATGAIAAILALLAGCHQSPADRTPELRAQCGRDARAWFAEVQAEYRRHVADSPEAGLISHFNVRDQRCYAQMQGFNMGMGSYSVFTLVDVDESTIIGESTDPPLEPPAEVGGLVRGNCWLADKWPTDKSCTSSGNGCRKCASRKEWEALVRPFMEQ